MLHAPAQINRHVVVGIDFIHWQTFFLNGFQVPGGIVHIDVYKRQLYLLEQALPPLPDGWRAARAAYTVPVLMFTSLFFGLFHLSDIGNLLSATFLQGFQFTSSKAVFAVTQYILPLVLGTVGLIPKFSLTRADAGSGPAVKAYRAVAWAVVLLLFVYSLFNLLSSETNPFFVLWQGV